MENTLLEKYAEEYFEKDITYKQNTQYFVDYVVNVCNLGNCIAKISFETFLESLRYYNDNAKINAESTALAYFEAVKAFYTTLVKRGYSKDIFDRVTVVPKVKEVIKELNLSAKKNRDTFTQKTIIEILSKLDSYIENTDYKKSDKVRFFNWSKLRLFIKLMLIAPAKKSVISKLKISDIDLYKHVIKVNSVSIIIPNSLYRDIKFYLKIKKILENDIDEFLFDNGNTYNLINGWFYYFLKEYDIIDLSEIKTGTYGIEVIMGSALQIMANNGASPILLATINDAKPNTLDKYYSKDVIKNEIDKEINYEVSKNQYYKYI